MKSQYENRVRELLQTKSIPWVVGWIHDLYENYEVDEEEEEYLYAIADPEERFNSPCEYWWCIDWDKDFTEEEIREWDEGVSL